MGGRAVAQRVDGGALRETPRFEGRPQGVLHTVAGHGCGSRGHAEAAAARRRTDPAGMALGGPVWAESLQGALWQRHRAVLGTCAAAHVHQHPGTIHIGPLEVGPCLKPEAARGDGGQADARAEALQVGQNEADLFWAEDDRELLCPWGSDKGQRGPFPLKGLLVEDLDAAECHGARAAGVVLDILEGEEVVAECFLRDPLRGLMGMFRSLTHGPDIHLLGAFGHSSELEILDHPLAQWGHGYTSCI
jgi:hypothetical protein